MSDNETTTSDAWRNPQLEAQQILKDGTAIVLEPSPPAVTVEPYFADDPVAIKPGAVVPSGLEGGDRSWDDVVASDNVLQEWAADRWLTSARRLPTVPSDLVQTRIALHRLAVYVVAPLRHRANTKFGLRWTLDGFGTPFFDHAGQPRQVRVVASRDHVLLVDQRGDAVSSVPVTTLADAARHLDAEIDPSTAAEHDSPPVGNTDEPLTIDPDTARFLSCWHGMAFAGLEAFRSRLATIDPSRPQLWPGHFDAALEAGDEATRGSYGASPGDDGLSEPYLYVSLWWPDRLTIDFSQPAWNATAFVGRVLPLSHFPVDEDPAAVATRFWAETAAMLH